MWLGCFKANEVEFNHIVKTYQLALTRAKEIEAEAQSVRSGERMIEIFNRRFFVPVELTAKNKVSVVLGVEAVPSLGFTFKAEQAEMERDDLLEVLSSQETKALHILNVIFEVEVRRLDKQPTIFIVDDITDSLDYKTIPDRPVPGFFGGSPFQAADPSAPRFYPGLVARDGLVGVRTDFSG